MGLKDFYYKIEDKYYAFLDWLDKRGISLYPIVDAIESKGIPSFPIMLLILALIIIGLWFLTGFFLVPAQANVAFLVVEATDNAPLEGAQISFTIAGEEKTFFTGDNGEKEIALPFGSIEIKAKKTGYKEKTKTINVEAGIQKQVFALEQEVKLLSRTIQLMNDRTNQLLLQEATIEFECSNSEANFSETKTTNNGRITIEVPENCGRLVARPAAGFTTSQENLDITDPTLQLFLDFTATEKGSVTVIVKDSGNNPVVGATIRLMKISEIEERTEYSSSSGTAAFADIPTGTYYIVVHAPNFAEYDGKASAKELTANQTITFNATLEEAASGKIKVLVKDIADKKAIENAVIKLKKGSTLLDTEYSDEEGKTEFSAVQGETYDLEIDHPNYLIATVNSVRTKEETNEIFLQQANISNSNTLYVTVLDERNNPIENAKLLLKKASDNKTIGSQKSTGTDGKAEFANLPFDTYYVFAEKKGFEGKNSETITLTARQRHETTITLEIGFGKIAVIARDASGNPIQGTEIKALNILDEKTEAEQSTSEEGKAEFELRADKTIFIRAEAEDYLPYNTATIIPDAGSTVTKEITMIKDTPKLEVEFKLLAGNETVLESITEGQAYTALLLLKIPKNTNYGIAGVHLRTGTSETGRTKTMQEDNLYIREARASTKTISKGTTYTPNNGYGLDSASLTSGDSKWVNVEWRNAKSGVYEIEAGIQVRDTASLGEALEIWYRGYGKTGTGYARFPTDKELGNAESTTEKQALYANANLTRFSVGPSNLCGMHFCKSYTIEDLATRIRTSTADSYTAKISNFYRFAFTLSNNSEQVFFNSVLKISNETQALKFLGYSITDAFGTESKGTADASELSKEIGTMQKNSVVFGTIVFSTEEEGSNPIEISIITENGSVFNETINVEVEAAKELEIDLLPKVIVPLIDNELLIRITDANKPVPESIINIFLNDKTVFSGKTSGKGELNYKLQAPNTGSTLKIVASKPGYKKAEISAKITDEILFVTPPEIEETLSTAIFEKDIGMRVSNATMIPMQLSSITTINLVPDDLVEFTLLEDLAGKEIQVNSDINFFLKARLSTKALLLDKTTTIKGSLAIETQNTVLRRTFTKNVPVEIRIALGNAVDDAKCLTIEPSKWKIITGTSAKTIEIKLVNTCKTAGETIMLKNLQAKIDLKNEETIGTFKITGSSISDAAKTEISEKPATILPIMEKESELTLTIEFSPKRVSAAEAMPNILFEATNQTEKKQEKISALLETEIHISKLTECIKINPEKMRLYPAPFNTGYDNYQNFGYNPTAYNGNGSGYPNGYTEPFAGTGTSSGYIGGGTLQNSFPYSQADMPFQSRYFENASSTSWNYGLGTNEIKIENNCTVPIEVSLEAEENLRTGKNKIVLDPEQSESTKVESGYLLGAFRIETKARIKESKDKPTKISEILVEVLRPEEISDDCIGVQPKKISMNSFYGAPQPGRIYNYCYHLGVTLEKTDRVIEFACRVAGAPGILAPTKEKTQTLQFQIAPPYNSEAFTNPNPTSAGYINSSIYAPQPYAPSSSLFNYNPTPPMNTGVYSPNEAYVPPGSSALFGQGYYNQMMPGIQGSGNGYYYPGAYNQGGYIGGAYPFGSNGWNFAASGGFEGACPLIDSVYVMGEKKLAFGKGTKQIIEFEVTPNLQYRRQLCNYQYGNQQQMPALSLYGMRMTAMGSYYRSNVHATATVNYRTPVGAQTAFFRIDLQDLWGYGEGLDACLANSMRMSPYPPGTVLRIVPPGTVPRIVELRPLPLPGPMVSPNIDTEKCINKDALKENLFWQKSLPGTKGFVPQENSWLGSKHTFTPNPQVLIISNSACGQIDKIELRSTATASNKDITFSFAVTNDGHDITMTTDRSELKMQCAKAKTRIKIAVKRPNNTLRETEFELEAEVWVLHEGIKAEEVTIDFLSKCETTKYTSPSMPVTPVGVAGFEACKEEETSEQAWNSFGFNRLPWKWQWEDIKEKTCDETETGKTTPTIENGGMLCDAVQFSIELNKKGKKISEYVEKVENTQTEQVTKALGTVNELQKYKNSKELFRWALSQASITDNAVKKADSTNANVVMFFNKKKEPITLSFNGNNGIMEETFMVDTQKIKNFFEELKETATAQAIDAAKMNAVLQKIKEQLTKENATGTSESIIYPLYIVMQITAAADNNSFIETNKDLLTSLGMDETNGKNYLTLAEYAKLHGSIVEAAGNNNCFIEEAPEKIDNTTSTVEHYTNDLSKAKRCKIKAIKEDKEIEIKISFLNDLYNNSSFLLVPVHKAGINALNQPMLNGLSMEKNPLLVDYLMENADEVLSDKDKEDASLSEYKGKTFKHFYYDNIDFSAYLIKDNYSEQFQKDFSQSQEYALKLTAEGIKEFGDSSKVAFENELTAGRAIPPGQLEQSGKYNILANYDWSTRATATAPTSQPASTGKWEIQFKTLEKTLENLGIELDSKQMQNNAFLSAPIDATLQSNPATMDYGISFSNAQPNFWITKIEQKQVSAVAGGDKTTEAKMKADNYIDTQKGIILQINPQNWVFSPSQPALITMTITQSNGNVIALYDFKTPEEYHDKEIDSLFTWVVNQKGTKDRLINLDEGKACSAGVNSKWFGFNVKATKPEFKTVGFFPLTPQYILNIICTKGASKINTSAGQTIDVPSGTAPSGKEVILTNSPSALENTIQDYLEKIKASKVCIKNATSENMTIAWNPAIVAKEITG